MVLMTQHKHCNVCGEPMPKARFGQRYCSQGCRAAGNAEEERVARRLWREAGRPREYEEIDLAALGFGPPPEPEEPVKRRKISPEQQGERS
jgi:predicted nucleic acid-binding Zn ribbon protein